MSTKNTSKSKSTSAPKSAAVASTKAKDLPAKKDAKGGMQYRAKRAEVER